MAIQSNFPAIKPSLMLDFANTKQLDPRITYTRASTATFYNGVTTAKAEENLAPRSQELNDTSVWSTQAVTVTANTSVAPDGTTTAETITASATSSTHFLFFGAYPTIAIGIQLGCSVFAKAGTNNFFQLSVLNEANTYANFDLSTGTIGTTGSNVSSVTMTSVGSGWYRCSFVITSTTNAANSSLTFAPVASNSVGRLPTWTPAGTETVILWGAQLEQRSAVSAYTATTTQAITNYIPVLQSAASGVARFDNNPTTGESLGLLIEESRTNLLTYSSQFDNAAWTKSFLTVTADTVVAPDGTLTGDKLVEDTSTNNHTILQGVSVSASTTYTVTTYAKASGRNWLYILDNSNPNAVQAFFDLSTGTVGNVGGSATATITSVGNSWYRCSVTFATGPSQTSMVIHIRPASANGTTSYTGNGFSGVFLWGAQVELGAFATSYIPTVASQVTRAADAASMTGTNFSSWFSNGEGTLYSDAKCNGITAAAFIAQLYNSGNDYIDFGRYQSTLLATVQANNTNQASLNSALSNSTSHKFAVGYAVNNFAASADGATVITDTSGLVPNNLNSLVIGNFGSAYYLNCTIKKLAYYPLRVTNAQLQALTS